MKSSVYQGSTPKLAANSEGEDNLVCERVTSLVEVGDKEEALRSAMLASDVTALSLLIDKELVFTGPDGTVLGKGQDLSAYKAGALTISKLTLFDHHLHRISDNVLVTTKADLEGTFAGNPINGTYAYTRLWSRASGQWRVIVGHAARLI